MRQVLFKLIPALALLLVIACAGAPATPTPLPAVAEVQGITYRAETRIQKSSPTYDVGPIMLRPWVTMTNTSDRRVETRVDGCAVRLRVYLYPSRSGTPVWDQEQLLGGRCMQSPYVITLEPGQSYEIAEAINASRILGDSLPPGHYYFTVVFRLSDQPLEFSAGDAELSFGVEGLTYRVETSVVDISPSKLQVIVTVTNTSNELVRIEYGACSVWLRAYSTPDRSGVPAWDERQRPNPDPKTGAYWACPAYLAITELDPGESITPKEFHRTVPIPDIMGGSLPDGPYYFTARVELNGTATELEAGDALLVKAQVPLPAERTVEGLSYRAETERMSTSPVTLRTTVTVTNTSNERMETTIARQCPVNLFVYQDEASRDAVPLRDPVWYPTSICYMNMLNFSLSPGESREFRARVTAPEILSNSLPDARYYFTVVVWTQDRRIVLAAGNAELNLPPDSRENNIPPTP